MHESGGIWDQDSVVASEVDAIMAVAKFQGIDGGLAISAFETALLEFFGMPSAVAVSSDCAALAVVLGALGVKPGAEVILPPTAPLWMLLPLLEAGIVPVFADIRNEDFSLSAQAVERAFSSRTQAVLAAPLWGYPAELTSIRETANARGVPLIVEISASVGASLRGVDLACLGNIACLSLRDGQVLSTGEGGVAFFQDPDLARRAKRYSQFGDLDGIHLGANLKLSPAQAALGKERLTRLGATLAERSKRGRMLLDDLTRRRFDPVQPIPDGILAGSHVILRRDSGHALEEPFPPLLHRLPIVSAAFASCPVAETLSDRIAPISIGARLKLFGAEESI